MYNDYKTAVTHAVKNHKSTHPEKLSYYTAADN